MSAHIDTLREMTIGQINDMDKEMTRHNKVMWDIMDRNRETVASSLQEEKCNEKWATDFLKQMEIERL